MKKGIFITFEGGEGCGKSYQARKLITGLEGLAIPSVLTHEPGGTPLGENVTRLLKWDNQQRFSPLTETLLFNVSRSHLIDTVIKPALATGKIVVCDRFTDSTAVYQGYARGLDLSLVGTINSIAAQNVTPDITILLDVPVEIGLGRKSKQKPDRFHRESLYFHRRVRNGFLKQAAKEPERWYIIDGTLPRNKVSSIVFDKVIRFISNPI